MVGLSAGTRVYLALGATDLRKSIDALALLVEAQFALSALSGHWFAFCNRRRTLVKVLYWDRNGFCLWQKRLEKETFRWPQREVDVLEVDARELLMLLEEMELVPRTAHKRCMYDSIY